MSDAVSKLGIYCLAGYGALTAYARVGTAISCEARAARQAASAVLERAERSQALFGEKAAAISRLAALANDCGGEGWDGNGASPINPAALSMAEAFVRLLPDGVSLPEFAPEPDGGVSLDWIQSRNRLFTVSIGQSNRFAYAWLDGGDKGHGVAGFDGERVPARILGGIRGITDYGNPALRPV